MYILFYDRPNETLKPKPKSYKLNQNPTNPSEVSTL